MITNYSYYSYNRNVPLQSTPMLNSTMCNKGKPGWSSQRCARTLLRPQRVAAWWCVGKHDNKNADFWKRKPRKFMPSSNHNWMWHPPSRKAHSSFPASRSSFPLATKGRPSDPPIFQLLCDQSPLKRERGKELPTSMMTEHYQVR